MLVRVRSKPISRIPMMSCLLVITFAQMGSSSLVVLHGVPVVVSRFLVGFYAFLMFFGVVGHDEKLKCE
jgi:hypothetical protein